MNVLVSKQSLLQSQKDVNRYNLDPPMHYKDKNFGGSLVLNFEI